MDKMDKITPVMIEAIYKILPDKAKADLLVALAKRVKSTNFAEMLKEAKLSAEERDAASDFIRRGVTPENGLIYDASQGYRDLKGVMLCRNCGRAVPNDVDYREDVGKWLCSACYNKVIQDSKKATNAAYNLMDVIKNPTGIVNPADIINKDKEE